MREGYEEIKISHSDFKELHQAGHIDELCRCGGLMSEHTESPRGRDFGVSIPGHGQCAERQCPQFTWVGFVRKVE